MSLLLYKQISDRLSHKQHIHIKCRRVPYQNCITVKPAAMQEEMSEGIVPAETKEPEMSMQGLKTSLGCDILLKKPSLISGLALHKMIKTNRNLPQRRRAMPSPSTSC